MTPVVVTGMSINSALGRDVEKTFTGVCTGASNFAPINSYSTTGSHVRVAGECAELDLNLLPDRKMQKVLRRKDLIAVTTAVAAFKDAACSGAVPAERIGVFTGVGCNHIGDLVPWFEAVKTSVSQEKGLGQVDSVKFGQLVSTTVNPIAVLQSLMNNALAYTTIALNARGANSNFIQFNTSGFRALAEGVRAIRDGSVDIAVVGAAAAPVEPFQAVESWVYGRLADVGEESAADVIRPWDKDARGTILGEGAAFVVLESEERARGRAAKVRGRILGFGFAADPGFRSGDGLTRATRLAIECAESKSESIALIVGEGNGDRLHDEQELRSLASVRELLGIKAPLWTSRASFGETEEAASMIDLVMTFCGFASGSMPAAPGVRRPLLDAAELATTETRLEGANVLMTARSKFGDCAAIVVGPP
jgi:3-oxoacyl-[acyl-carrier-protein] synthase II